MTKQFYLFQVVLVALLGGAWHMGWLQPLFSNDASYLSYGIAVLLVFGIVTSYKSSWEWVGYCISVAPLLGLLGTVIGIKMAVDGAAGQVMELRDLGLSTALNTTILGMCVSTYLYLLETHFKDAKS